MISLGNSAPDGSHQVPCSDCGRPATCKLAFKKRKILCDVCKKITARRYRREYRRRRNLCTSEPPVPRRAPPPPRPKPVAVEFDFAAFLEELDRQVAAEDPKKANSFVPTMPPEETNAIPGTKEKIEVLAARYLAGWELFHPRDATVAGPRYDTEE